MNNFWRLNHCDAIELETFNSLEKVINLKGEPVTQSPISRLQRVRLAERDYYVKVYTQGGKYLRRFIGKSRAQTEWENLLYFSQLNIPIPRLVAFGMQSRYGVFKYGALITAGINSAMDLANLSQQQGFLFKNQDWCRSLLAKLAQHIKQLHQSKFIHNDLKWRNLLVDTSAAEPLLYFIDCPNGRHYRWPFFMRGVIKDLACLDKVARQQLSRTQRLYFYKVYTGCNKLTAQHKQQLKNILLFFNGRE